MSILNLLRREKVPVCEIPVIPSQTTMPQLAVKEFNERIKQGKAINKQSSTFSLKYSNLHGLTISELQEYLTHHKIIFDDAEVLQNLNCKALFSPTEYYDCGNRKRVKLLLLCKRSGKFNVTSITGVQTGVAGEVPYDNGLSALEGYILEELSAQGRVAFGPSGEIILLDGNVMIPLSRPHQASNEKKVEEILEE